MSDTFRNKPYIVKPWLSEDVRKLESLGIEMIPSPPCGTFVNIPDGWTFKKESDYIAESTAIYDDKGRRRVYSCHFFPVKRYVQDDFLRIDTRYFIRRAENWKTATVVDGVDNTELFTVEVASGEEYKKAKNKCREFLKENYPKWEDPSKYWD